MDTTVYLSDGNGDGLADTTMVDTNGDHVADSVTTDLNGDGTADVAVYDVDADGYADVIVVDPTAVPPDTTGDYTNVDYTGADHTADDHTGGDYTNVDYTPVDTATPDYGSGIYDIPSGTQAVMDMTGSSMHDASTIYHDAMDPGSVPADDVAAANEHIENAARTSHALEGQIYQDQIYHDIDVQNQQRAALDEVHETATDNAIETDRAISQAQDALDQ
ncbi:hypothetical protein [Actinokineospora enzanensis]|uniref:hypothetical protein n=1 Tax=Actinokineospora enzanensis TaxID=155975 RepID=UPI00035CAF66|nr:hypothetical protein [Actinokineospora enzanensis]